MPDTRPITIFCDIDGTLVEHHPPNISAHPGNSLKILANTISKLTEWDAKGYNIILTSGRKEGMRKVTEEHLAEVGIFYDQLVLGIGGGVRYLINDRKSDGRQSAFAICCERDGGIGEINITNQAQ
jgi:hypothetical protein